MDSLPGFSESLQLPNIPEGPGVCVIEDDRGHVLQVGASNNVRRFIGEMFDSQGTLSTHGPKIYDAQQAGERIIVRWKLTPDYKAEKRRLMNRLNPLWAE
jgi:hypothetical protein